MVGKDSGPWSGPPQCPVASSGQDYPGTPWPPAPHTFRTVPRGCAVTLGLTLLHGRWPQGLGALPRWLASVAGAAHQALLLPEAALHRALWGILDETLHSHSCPGFHPPGAPTYLTPLSCHPAGRGAAPQVAAHGGWWLGCRQAVCGGQCCTVVCTLAKDCTVAEAWPAAGGALQSEGAFHAQWAIPTPDPTRTGSGEDAAGPVDGKEGLANFGPVQDGPLGLAKEAGD